MKTIKRLLLSLSVILIVIFASEAGIRLFSPVSSEERTQFVESAWSWPTSEVENFEGPLMSAHVSHPFWGFHLNPRIADLNKMGFDDPDEFPYQRKDGEIVIALLGGSVALGSYKFLVPALQTALKTCGRPVKVLNFAQGAHKQPSQFHIYTYFLETFDVSINIDGLNDALFYAGGSYPSAYPVLTDQLFYLDTKRTGLMESAFFYAKLQHRIAKTYHKNKNLFHSDLLFRISKNVFNLAEEKKQNLMKEMSVPLVHIQEPNHDMHARLKEQISIWEKYTKLQHELSRLHNKKSFFFLQPSQYLKNGKVLTSEEKDIAFLKDPKELARYTEAYELLPLSAKTLKDKSGVDMTDLSGLFTPNPETIFTDDCCHINDHGNTLMAQAVAQKIAPYVAQHFCKNARMTD